MRRLLKRTVQTAVEMDLVELALQAVDGTKVGASRMGRLDEEAVCRHLPEELHDRKVVRRYLALMDGTARSSST